jgi:hypothetical protein
LSPLDLVVHKLHAAGCDPSPTGPSAYESRCPAHNGKRKNLSVRSGDDGRVLLHCHHAGEDGSPSCPPEAITGALGLRLEDLFSPKPNGTHTSPTKTPGKRSWPTPEDALRAIARKIEPQPTSLQSWTYHDARGTPVMVVGRIGAANGEKTYRPVHALPDGSWAIGDPPGLLPLYGLREIGAAGAVIVLEGEKCADAARVTRWAATTSAHGAKSADKTDWTPLAGKEVVVIPDNDAAGEGYASTVLRLLKRLNPRPRVKVVRLAGLADGEDFVEWSERIAREGPEDEATEAVRFELRQLSQAAEPIDLDAIEDAPAAALRPVEAIPAAEVPIPVPEWPDPPEDAAFHMLAGLVVRLIEPSTEADPVALLVQFLVGIGNAVGRGAWAVADGHRHYPNDFAVMVGDTSRARKGTSWRRVLPILARAEPEWADARIAGGLSSGEGLIHEIRDPVFGTDDNGDPVCKDRGVEDKRVLVVESEFGNVLRVLAREGNTLSGVLRQAWDSDPLRTMTKHSPTKATEPHVSLIGHVTQQELARYLSAVEMFNGLGNRVLWCSVRRSKCLPLGGRDDPREIARLGDLAAGAVSQAKTRGEMGLSPSGSEVWVSEYGRITKDRPGRWGPITSRAEAHVLRLALIYALLDTSPAIEDTHVLAALSLWRYCDRSAGYLFGGSVGDRDADAILSALRPRPEGMTRTEIHNEVFNKNKSAADVTRASSLLLRYELARCEPAGGGVPERWFAVNVGSTPTNCTNSTNSLRLSPGGDSSNSSNS